MKNTTATSAAQPRQMNRSRPPLEAILTALEDATSEPFETMDPLYETLDPDALETLCAHAVERQTALEIAFVYAGYDVRVRVDRFGDLTVDVVPEP